MDVAGPFLVEILKQAQSSPEVCSDAELRQRVNAVVAAGKRLHLPPEQIVTKVKALMAEAGVRPSDHPTFSFGAPPARDGLYRKVFRWTVEECFADPS